MTDEPAKPVRWVRTSLRDLRSFPDSVRLDVGHALFAAQQGKTDPAAKPLKGFGGASVLEIVASRHGGTWRAVYTVRFALAVYALLRGVCGIIGEEGPRNGSMLSQRTFEFIPEFQNSPLREQE